MRELNDFKVNGVNESLKVQVLDEPGQGGANHIYCVSGFEAQLAANVFPEEGNNITVIAFQNGPLKENKANGLTHEVLLSIVADRLRSFQAGPFSSSDNAIALMHVEDALLRLQKRTNERLRRGVEGTNQK